MQISDKVRRLIEKGVKISEPLSVEIGAEVQTRNIATTGVILHPGTRILGKKTLIGPGSEIGFEGPATLIDCRLGRNVELKGGFFRDSLFLDRASLGSGAQVREACLLEEESGGNHAVGLKQTILFPYVTLGSLINFCDCFMAGGTSRKNHSEVGSSFIHFNYTPNQDKATASLLGDVPRGVMLDRPPIFLGGQGGIVGPVRLGFGTVTVAGAIIRKDCPEGGKILGSQALPVEKDFLPGYYADIRRKVMNNILYMANLMALRQWYGHIRHRFFEMQEFGSLLQETAVELIGAALAERLKRLRDLADKIQGSLSTGTTPGNVMPLHRQVVERWPQIEHLLLDKTPEESAGITERDAFIRGIWAMMEKKEGDYLQCIGALDSQTKTQGTAWLQAIIDRVVEKTFEIVPVLRIN